MHAIIELTGKVGVGKTLLAMLLVESFPSALFIDASPDRALTLALCPQPPELTVAALFSRRGEAMASREAIDWVFHDLVSPVGEEGDLMTLGELPGEMPPGEEEKLGYGLNRLMETYDYVVVDGFHPLLRRLLPDERLSTLEIVTPATWEAWKPTEAENRHHTPALILNRYRDETLPPVLDEALIRRQVQLIGKLPEYGNLAECLQNLPEQFQNCLLKLDIPLNPHCR